MNKWLKYRVITRNIVVIWVNIFNLKNTIEIQLVRPTEVCVE